ncbi:hypothetical protein FHG87_015706 [Trinorchestia longiramus]|nr:hypothetical protein FHG87_015706 [Trinorchestia longiramus]
MSSVETMRFSTFKNKRIPKNNLQRVHATNNSCECLQTCRIHSFCYGASYGIMYTSSSVGIQLGTLGICHITINPTVPKNLETSSGYTTMIMGSTDSGCEEAYGFSNMGPAGCIRLVSTAAKRSDAIDACKKVGGVLAVLSSAQAYNVVVKALTRIGNCTIVAFTVV